MKKLTTLFGLLFCASLFLTSCSSEEKSKEENKVVDTAESDAKKLIDCLCDAYENKDEKAVKKCEEIATKHENKYKGTDDEEAYMLAAEKAAEDCDAL